MPVCEKCGCKMGGWPPSDGHWVCYNCTPKPTPEEIRARGELEVRQAAQVVRYWIGRFISET